jgi:hypothetical protein
VIEAYPEARINFIGGQGQIDLMTKATGDEFKERVKFVAWTPQLDRDTLPADLYQTYIRLQKLPFEVFKGATRLVFCSCTATVLTAITVLGLAKRSSVVLHGNANDLSGWRSKNPARRWLDFPASMRRFVNKGGTAVVLENRLIKQLTNLHPWLKNSIFSIPHPLLPEERSFHTEKRDFSYPINIGFAGNASIDKGFTEFLDFADALNRKLPGIYRFHAIGFLPKESFGFDQSALVTRASRALSRQEYLEKLKGLDYIFLWHQEKYYANAPSGVVYDAVNLTIPLIARDYAQISEWESRGQCIGLSFKTLEDAVEHFSKVKLDDEIEYQYILRKNIIKIQDEISTVNSASLLANSMPLIFKEI